MDLKALFGPRGQQVTVYTVKVEQQTLLQGAALTEALEGAMQQQGPLREVMEPWDKGAPLLEVWKWGAPIAGHGVVEVSAEHDGPRLMVRVRQAKSPDRKLIKERVRRAFTEAEERWAGQRTAKGKPKYSKMDRGLIKESAELDLIKEAQAKCSVHAVVWDRDKGQLLVFGGGPKVREACSAAACDLLGKVLGSRVFLARVQAGRLVEGWTGTVEGSAPHVRLLDFVVGLGFRQDEDGRDLERVQIERQSLRVEVRGPTEAELSKGLDREVIRGTRTVREALGRCRGDRAWTVGRLDVPMVVRDGLAHRPETLWASVDLRRTGALGNVTLPKALIDGLGLVLDRVRQVQLLEQGVETIVAAAVAGGAMEAQAGLPFAESVDVGVVTVGPVGGNW